jgi:predicted unusual protein kinase regulating ubiquinone biosynthesis (AarF/ABC1/UbiB family)
MPIVHLHRRVRLLSLPAGAIALSAQGAIRRARGQDPDVVRADLRTRNAARTRRVLGELKGGALKAGQLLSTVEALFPADPEDTWRDALVGLQESNGALPFTQVEPVLRAELGAAWGTRFAAFDTDATAAASIGQVHRATWSDGRQVAVKVQYPGVREALAGDLRTISVLSRAAALIARGLALPPLVTELRDRLTEELDYLHEAVIQRDFAAAYRDDPDVVVPDVVHATPRILVQDWVAGTPLAHIARSGDQAARDAAAGRYQRFLVAGPERAGWLHTDPHPGNFRILDDGRLGVLDFGSALRLPGGLPPTFGRLLSALHSRDHAEIERRLRTERFLLPGRSVDIGKLTDYMGPFVEPSRHERFTFSREWLRSEFGRINDPRNPDFAVALQLNVPAEHLFTHRVWLGMVGVLCQLDATVEVRAVLERWVTGFEADDLDGSRVDPDCRS